MPDRNVSLELYRDFHMFKTSSNINERAGIKSQTTTGHQPDTLKQSIYTLCILLQSAIEYACVVITFSSLGINRAWLSILLITAS